MAKDFIIRSNADRDALIARMLSTEVTEPYVIRVILKGIRSIEQNDKLHAEIRDVSKTVEFAGRLRKVPEWKMLFVSGFDVAQKRESEVVEGLEGEIVNLRRSTAEMGVGEMMDLITYIQAWRAGV